MKTNWNPGWFFTKENVLAGTDKEAEAAGTVAWEAVCLPHTWNALDGTDGGNDYYRGTCYYRKCLRRSECEGEEVYLEFEGANSSADVYVNGAHAGHHDGGYSTFRVRLTPYLQEENEILVAVDNSPNDRVYPQMADFTFYGGLYRNVNLICVPKAHFDLDFWGSPGVRVTPVVKGADADVEVMGYFTGLQGTETVTYTILEGETVLHQAVLCTEKEKTEYGADFFLEKVHLWKGRKDPFLYTLKAELKEGETVLDERIVRFGCRFYEIDPEKGFFLNGEPYPLRGVSRHQDRKGLGNALLAEHHKEDLQYIYEVGANTIRLAHYQHNQVIYDTCDELGLILWAEIPYISVHMPTGRENTITQMKELIAQNYNHPSIVVWGLSNEITMRGGVTEDLLENHRILNDLCHEWDKTRKTTMAIVSMCNMDSEYVQIPDTVAWNHYFGWYGGDTSMNGPWFDRFHSKHPQIPAGMSEYGCEALNWHTSRPEQGDYTEEYQAFYHEELIRQLFSRDYIWSTYVWNMFDFGADARSEGGEDGQNHKGLMTFDRAYKKDSFYAYKAWLSDEPFVHICGKRYVNREEEVTKVTVYSNQPEVELFANGVSLGVQRKEDHFFYFDVPNQGTTQLKAVAGACEDTSRIVKVAEFDNSYRMVEAGDVLNWFDITAPEGYFSINDKMSDIMSNPQGAQVVGRIMQKTRKGRPAPGNRDEKGAAAGPGEGRKEEGKEDGKEGGRKEGNKEMMSFLGGFTVKRLLSMAGAMGGQKMSKEEMLELNRELNQIRK